MKPNILESGKCFQKTGTNTDVFDFKKVEFKGEERYMLKFYERQLSYKLNEFYNDFVITCQKIHHQTMRQRKEITERRNKKNAVAEKCSQITFINGIEIK